MFDGNYKQFVYLVKVQLKFINLNYWKKKKILNFFTYHQETICIARFDKHCST
jgi:hypothetical protein